MAKRILIKQSRDTLAENGTLTRNVSRESSAAVASSVAAAAVIALSPSVLAVAIKLRTNRASRMIRNWITLVSPGIMESLIWTRCSGFVSAARVYAAPRQR